jgi:hypothetical protein
MVYNKAKSLNFTAEITKQQTHGIGCPSAPQQGLKISGLIVDLLVLNHHHCSLLVLLFRFQALLFLHYFSYQR